VERKKLVRKAEPPSKHRIRWPRWTGFRGMTVRDWLSIVGALLIPVVIAAGTWGITWQQGKIEDKRAQAERDLAEQRAQDEALQDYLDQMSSLLLREGRPLREANGGYEERTLARARTLTVLEGMDPSGKRAVIQFLSEAFLIQDEGAGMPVVSLEEADLSGADLHFIDLRGAILWDTNLRDANLRDAELSDAELNDADLHGANLRSVTVTINTLLYGVDLGEANLSRTLLTKASLQGSDLDEANLSRSYLMEANLNDTSLSNADLSGTNLSDALLMDAKLFHADLSGANLSGADLSGANLSEVNLSGADLGGTNLLSGTNLSDAKGITNEELQQQAASLEGATMPTGQKYEEWLKSKGREEDAKTNGATVTATATATASP
jgi:uncharacterized protein YjbI with pentapeptide repeats